MCNDIRQSSHHQVRKVFASGAEKLEEDLAFIRKNEIRINKQNEKAINDLGQITQKKKKLASELRSLIQQVKENDYESKELQQQIQTVQNAYDEKMEDMGGQKQVHKIKDGLKVLRK